MNRAEGVNAKTIQKNMGFKLVFSVLFICFAICIPFLSAQQGETAGGREQEPGGQQAPDFSNQELERFARVESKVDELLKQYARSLGGVDEPDKSRKLQDKYLQRMLDAIRGQGLSIEKYNKINQAAQTNPELRKKIDKMAD